MGNPPLSIIAWYLTKKSTVKLRGFQQIKLFLLGISKYRKHPKITDIHPQISFTNSSADKLSAHVSHRLNSERISISLFPSQNTTGLMIAESLYCIISKPASSFKLNSETSPLKLKIFSHRTYLIWCHSMFTDARIRFTMDAIRRHFDSVVIKTGDSNRKKNTSQCNELIGNVCTIQKMHELDLC